MDRDDSDERLIRALEEGRELQICNTRYHCIFMLIEAD
jgi:hypothetical protein